jgi:hypothetical protein
MNKSRIHPCVLFLLLLAIVPATALAAGTTVHGVVLGSALAPLAGVHIAADEVGASRDTDAKGQFSLTVSPEVEQKGLVRLTFSLRDHQTYSIEVKLPHTSRLQVILSPLFARSFQPILPPDFTGRLRDYRQDDIKRVHTFLGSQEKKLLILEGLPSVDAADLLLVALQDVPAGSRKPILWWDCDENDSLTLIAGEWARAFRDTNLGNLLTQRQQLQNAPSGREQDRRDLDREILAWLLARLEKSPHTIVLTRFDQWLAPESRQIEDATLSDLVRRVVSHPQKGKMILVSEEKPVLPRDLNPAWVDGFLVPGLSPRNAVDFLRNHLGLHAGPELVKQAAEKLGGHPERYACSLGASSTSSPKSRKASFASFSRSNRTRCLA